MRTVAVFAAFVATVYAANWALDTFGTVPVAPGLDGPAGVYFAGLGFLLRDVLHEQAGRLAVLAAIGCGALLSWLLGTGSIPGGVVSIAAASGLSFAASELADLAVYTPLRERNLISAVTASQLAGAVVDSVLFLWLAFGAVEGRVLAGQLVGKTLLVAPAVALLFAWRARRLEAAA